MKSKRVTRLVAFSPTAKISRFLTYFEDITVGDEARCIFAYGENQCVAAIELAASKSPPDSCII